MNRRLLLATALLPMAAQAHGSATQHGSLTLEAPWTRAAGRAARGLDL